MGSQNIMGSDYGSNISDETTERREHVNNCPLIGLLRSLVKDKDNESISSFKLKTTVIFS
jgi:hypothetical protein